jgi:hypothetical protein
MAMAYDEKVAQRIRGKLQTIPGLVEKKMFGGIGFMLRGNMAFRIVSTGKVSGDARRDLEGE